MPDVQRVAGLAETQLCVISRSQALSAGLPRTHLDWLCRTDTWTRVGHQVYVPDGLPRLELPRTGQIRAAMLSYGPSAVAVLATAAELHGIAGLPRTDRVDLTLPARAARRRRPREPWVRLHQFGLSSEDVVEVAGIPVTSVLRTVMDLVLREERLTAVSLLDSALNQQLISKEDLDRLVAMVYHRRGAVAARKHLAEADGRAESPLETRVRLRCVDGGVPPQALQYEVRSPGGVILGYGDLAWPDSGLIGEADGAGVHGLPSALLHDRRRQNDFANAGFTVLRFTWQDTVHPTYIPRVVRQALGRTRSKRPF